MLHGSSSASPKMSATKNGEKCPSAPPSSPLCRPQILPILVTAIVNFLGSCSNLKFYECTLTSVRTAFITNLQSTIFKDRIDILLSHYSEWEHELLIMASLFPFSRILGISKSLNTHRLMFKSGFVTALQLTIFRISCKSLSQLLALICVWIL